MSDLISRADAIDAVLGLAQLNGRVPTDSVIFQIKALPSADAKGDLISRELAMERIANDNVVGGMERINEYNNSTEFNEYLDGISDAITTVFCDVPSAEADGEDLIIKGAKGIQDGLYNIKDGKLFKYKANGGTVRTYPIVPSADAVHGEWIDIDNYYRMATCSHCNKVTMFEKWGEHIKPYNFCPNCGAEMTKESEE